MTRIKEPKLTSYLEEKLASFSDGLPGIINNQKKEVLIAQIIDSNRRIEYLRQLSIRSKSPILHTPYSGYFDAFKGAAALQNNGQIEEAYWLVYLGTHFGKHIIDAWNLTEDFYGRLGHTERWDWERAKSESRSIEEWIVRNLSQSKEEIRSRRFSNHRKYESLKAGPRGAGAAIKSYIDWIMQYGSHAEMIKSIQSKVGQNPKDVFAYIYKDLDKVMRLGRLGKFDLLCNWSNLGTAPILPDRSYIDDASGPRDGAKLLFGATFSKQELEQKCIQLSEYLDLSPQVIEDSLCNWQKNTQSYKFFRG